MKALPTVVHLETGDKFFLVLGQHISHQVVVVVFVETNGAVRANESGASIAVYLEGILQVFRAMGGGLLGGN